MCWLGGSKMSVTPVGLWYVVGTFGGGCVSSSGDVSNFVTVVGRGTSRVANNYQQSKALVSCECGK